MNKEIKAILNASPKQFNFSSAAGERVICKNTLSKIDVKIVYLNDDENDNIDQIIARSGE